MSWDAGSIDRAGYAHALRVGCRCWLTPWRALRFVDFRRYDNRSHAEVVSGWRWAFRGGDGGCE
jgi:hypothetical protein